MVYSTTVSSTNLWKKLKRHPRSTSSINEAADNFQESISEARTVFETELISDHTKNNSRFFKYIRSVCKHQSFPSAIVLDDCQSSDDFEKAELFNYTFFISVFNNSKIDKPDPDLLTQPHTTLDLAYFHFRI